MSSPEEKAKTKKVVQQQPQWAWLPQDHSKSVHVVLVQDPDVVFLRINYFAGSLQKLINEIQQYASTLKKDEAFTKSMELGTVCLGKPSGSDEWNRAIIRSKPAEDSVELFFVDYGDIEVIPWSQVMPISNKLIKQLPFQVIECYLAGLQFLTPESEDKEWEDDLIDMIYNLSRDENEEALSLMVKVCSVEDRGKYTGGRRYKVVLADCSVHPFVTINSKLASSPFALMVDKDELLGDFQVPNNFYDNSKSSGYEEEIPSSSNLQVALPSQACMDEDSEMSENDIKIKQVLKDIEEGDFDFSIFHGIESIENDADVSDIASEGSVLSLPRSRGSLPLTSTPLTSTPQLQLPPPETEDSMSCSSKTLSSSHNSSTISLNQATNKTESFESNQHNVRLEIPSSCAPVTPSSSCHQMSDASSPDSSTPSLLRLNLKANHFKDLISPNLIGSNQPISHSSPPLNFAKMVSPFLKRVSPPGDEVCPVSDGSDDTELDNRISEINKSKEKINPVTNLVSNHKSNVSFTEVGENKNNRSTCVEMKPDGKEPPEMNKSPCQKWVESVIPDSDEDLSFEAQDLRTETQEAENTDLETRTPLVEWHQDDSFVFLHIKLPGLTEYRFSSDITSVHFSTVYGGIPYNVNLTELFGGHKNEKAQGIAKAFYFEIRLEKLLKGKRKRWPRLTKSDEKFHWLKLNPEKACEGIADSDDEDLKRLACTLPLWNENPTDSISIASSERTEFAGSELSL